MSQRERPSLADLKRPLAARGGLTAPESAAEAAILGAAPTVLEVRPEIPQEIHPAVPATIQPTVLPNARPSPPPYASVASAGAAAPALLEPPVPAVAAAPSPATAFGDFTTLRPRRREIRIAWTFKMPPDLHQELSDVAAHNQLSMTDIVIEALRLHLGKFPHPNVR